MVKIFFTKQMISVPTKIEHALKSLGFCCVTYHVVLRKGKQPTQQSIVCINKMKKWIIHK